MVTELPISFTVYTRPVGVNQIYRIRGGRNGGEYKNAMYMTPEGKAFKSAIAKAGREAMEGRQPIAGKCAVHLTIWYASKRYDVDASVKPILDALQTPTKPAHEPYRAGIILDDNQVDLCVVRRLFDATNPRVAIHVMPAANQEMAVDNDCE